MKPIFRNVLNALLFVVIPIPAIGLAAGMVLLAPEAESKTGGVPVVNVEVVAISLADTPAIVAGTGLVEASRQVALAPEVGGRVVYTDPRLMPGGRVAQGETLLRVDTRDYQTALAADEARLAQVELEVALERQRQLTARREWDLVGGNKDEEPLALRRPHLAAAEANLKSAQAAVERSKLNITRTSLRAPFNAVVVAESVEEGVAVRAGTVITVPEAARPFLRLPAAAFDVYWDPNAVRHAKAV